MKSNECAVIIDYGMGNLMSVESAITYLGYQVRISSDPSVILNASSLILPGVGSFQQAMKNLKQGGLGDAIKEAVTNKSRKILGICLGMQLLATSSVEGGVCEGLNLISSSVKRFEAGADSSAIKIPHIGFNEVKFSDQSLLYRGLKSPSHFYFVHSYYLSPESVPGILGYCNYGHEFLASYEADNVFATQFHPEKSQTNGLVVLKNFLGNKC